MKEYFADDAILIRRSQNGDKRAFDELIRKHESRAYQYAYRLTRNSEEASDVVAESFARVYNAIHNFKSQSAFTTWLYRILTNCFLDMRKREKGRTFASLDAAWNANDGELERQIEDPGRTPLQLAESRERERRVQEAVDNLPEYQRAIIAMYHGEMMSYEEIAETLGLPIGTVKSRLNRARLSLRELLSEERELFAIA